MNTYRTSKKYKIIFFINKIFNKINPTPYLQRGLMLNIDNNSSLHHNHISVNNINWQSFFSKKQKAEIKGSAKPNDNLALHLQLSVKDEQNVMKKCANDERFTVLSEHNSHF